MTPAERETLEALARNADDMGAVGYDQSVEDAAAIRSALATIDALNLEVGAQRSRVVNLVSRITGKPGEDTNEAVGEAARTALALRKAKERLDAIDREAEFTHPAPTLDEAQALAVLMQGAAALARNPETRELATRMKDAVDALKEHGGGVRVATIEKLRAEVADLRGRAIPKAWVDAVRRGDAEVRLRFSWTLDGPSVEIEADENNNAVVVDGRCVLNANTLAAALDAAAKES